MTPVPEPAGTRHLTLDTALAWAEVVDDRNPLHTDPEFAATTRFQRPIAHGSLLFALICDALQQGGAHHGDLTVRFRAPVPLGSTVALERDGAGVRLRCGDHRPVDVTWSPTPADPPSKEHSP
ncbi:MaoC family dehydratase [Streptomyces odontomachi]|uniref:MaoC family dehydratase n=1 Tax=Streptomyces odontomachi TaxID=2944940 RepID=UPI00210CAC90|nr:MaoC family dehydratase [Streptomyces sp. ODS25]